MLRTVTVGATLRQAASLAGPYWRSEERLRAGLILLTILGLTLALVAVTVASTYWQRALFNSLENKDPAAFVALLLTWTSDQEAGFVLGFGPLLAIHVLCTTYSLYLKQALQIRWRHWLTSQMVANWMTDKAYYRMHIGPDGVDNPDQRIAEDVNLFVDKTLSLGLGLFQTVVSILSFIVLLWILSRDVSFWGITVPGSLVWIALAYATIATTLTHIIGKQLVSLNFLQQHREADFRFGLMQLREHQESVAFHDGEAQEKRRLDRLFGVLADNWRKIMGLTKRITFFSASVGQATLVFPLMVSAPAYFAGSIPLGGVFQTANALNRVVENMSWFVSSYIELAAYGATIQRLGSFRDAVDRAQVRPTSLSLRIQDGPAYKAEGLNINLPDGRRLLSDVNFELSPGQSMMITGPSGHGKSTLLRTLAGIWPYASGTLTRPQNARTLFAPQESYVPHGTLRAAIEYPGMQGVVSGDQLEAALNTVGLASLVGGLDIEEDWAKRLSGGEAQRVIWARIIVNRPEILFLDEATASLDIVWEETFYSYLKQELPRLTLVSITHRPNLTKYHGVFIEVDREWGVSVVRPVTPA